MVRSVEANRNPAIERAMALLDELERSPNGASLDELSSRTKVSRSSAYRILNSLEAHRMIRSLRGGSYVLGSRVLQLASGTAAATVDFDLPHIVQPHIENAVRETGESAKVSIYDRGAVLVIAGASATTGHALHTVVGRYLSLHAGAAGKVLLTHLPEEEINRFLRTRLRKFTELTLTDEAELRPELEKVKAQGWAYDAGEYNININSYGAPVFARDGKMVAAISIPFGAGRDQVHHERVKMTVLQIAEEIGIELVRH